MGIKPKLKRFVENRKNSLILLLTILLAIKVPAGGEQFLLWIGAGVVTAAVIGFLLNKIFRKKRVSLQKALITGFIVSGVLDYTLDWPILVIFTAAAVLSKFIIRVNNKHVFNPAGFGLFAAALFSQPLTWDIESNVYLIIAAGVYLAVSSRRWPLVLGFLLAFSGAFYFSGENPLELVNWFFFIMLIDPKTSAFGIGKGLVSGGMAGVAGFLTFKFLPRLDMFVAALIAANVFNAAFSLIKRNQKKPCRAISWIKPSQKG